MWGFNIALFFYNKHAIQNLCSCNHLEREPQDAFGYTPSVKKFGGCGSLWCIWNTKCTIWAFVTFKQYSENPIYLSSTLEHACSDSPAAFGVYRRYSFKSLAGDFLRLATLKAAMSVATVLAHALCAHISRKKKKKKHRCPVCRLPRFNPIIGSGVKRYIINRIHITWWRSTCHR